MRGLSAALLPALLALLLITPALAAIDLISPAQGAVSNGLNVTFEYYPSLDGVESCTLTVDTQPFLDTTITNNAFNTFTVVNIDPGSHVWSIACQNSAGSESSVARSFLIDRSQPNVSILAPLPDATTTGAVTFLATDDNAATMRCTVNANATYVTDAIVQNGTPATLNLSLSDGTYQLMVTCLDNGSNAGSDTRTATFRSPPPLLFLNLTMPKSQYSLGEPAPLRISTLQGANVSIEVCPDSQGFVQCYTPLIAGPFPQTVVLPYTNRTGRYLVDGVALYGNQSAASHLNYTVTNTMTVAIAADHAPLLNDNTTLTASAAGGIGAVTYRWNLSSGSKVTGSSVTVAYTVVGVFTERVTATDSAGNNATASFTFSIEPLATVTVTVTDGKSGQPLRNATVQLKRDGVTDEPESLLTDEQGMVAFEREPDTYKLFVSKAGYSYFLNETKIMVDVAFSVTLQPEDNDRPVVTLLSPANGSTVGPPVRVGYTVQDSTAARCTISLAKGGVQWLQQAGTQTITDSQAHYFDLPALEETGYLYLVECVDAAGNQGASEQRSFQVQQGAQAEPLAPVSSDDPLAVIDQAYGAYDSFIAEQKAVADLLGWEDLIKERKRAIERAERDIQALQFRRDLDAAERARQQAALEANITQEQATVPIDLAILGSRQTMEYTSDEYLTALVPAIRQQKGYAFTDGQLGAYLKGVQQEFTLETSLVRAKVVYADRREEPLSIVTHDLQYKAANGSAPSPYSLYEAIPADVATGADELVTANEKSLLSAQPLAFEFGAEQRITYYVRKDVSLDSLAGVRTVLLKRPSASDLEAATGHSILSFVPLIDWRLSLLLTLVVVFLVILLRRAPLLRHVKYLLYAESRKRGLHEVRLLVNDGLAQLESGELDGAMMRYKEAKLSYERLSEYGQNEVFADLERLRLALDGCYFVLLSDRIHEAMVDGRLADAVDDYERLEGTFARLGKEEQARLVEIVLELGRRLGMTGEQNAGGSMGAVSGVQSAVSSSQSPEPRAQNPYFGAENPAPDGGGP